MDGGVTDEEGVVGDAASALGGVVVFAGIPDVFVGAGLVGFAVDEVFCFAHVHAAEWNVGIPETVLWRDRRAERYVW